MNQKQLYNVDNVRKTYIDYLNVIACFCVVYMHHNSAVYHYKSEKLWFISLAVETLCYWAVPIFFMISGANLLSYRQKYSTLTFLKKRIMKTLFPWIFWSIGALVLQILKGTRVITNLNPAMIVSEILNCKVISIYWFFPAVIACYLIIPFFSSVEGKVENAVPLFGGLCTVWFVMEYTIPLVFKFLNIDGNSELFVGGGYLLYILLGYILDRVELVKWQRIVIYFAGVCSVIFRYVYTAVSSTGKGITDTTLFSYKQFHTVLLASAVFIFFKQINWSDVSERLNQFVRRLSSLSLGIYLLHIVVVYQITGKFITVDSMAWRIVAPMITYIISGIIIWCLKQCRLTRIFVP